MTPDCTMGLATKYLAPFLVANWLDVTLACLAFLLVKLLLSQPSRPVRTVHIVSRPEQLEDQAKKGRVNVTVSGGVGDRDKDLVASDTREPLWPEDLTHVHYKFTKVTPEESIEKSRAFYELMKQRRTIRVFSSDPVPREVVDNVIKAAGTAPSGAHTEPWTFVVVSDPEVKQQIRTIVETEEEINYTKRMGTEWVMDLRAMRTDWVKEYLTVAPWLILVFKQTYGLLPDGSKRTHYYHEISTALAGGILLSAIHSAGLATLTSTPLNCGPSLRTLLKRPINEKLLLLMPLGYPAPNTTIPNLSRKPLDKIMVVV
ncbi:iodotyrosine deiodinase isoform X2 [Procambarus clarkii]|uniref:iodotyrosine deiodinase isoform X2 n=1 Tax=Procambarus clarkii TaxID=6728 RepID=UPI001E676E12|nr:iodotyrosine deiodinase 1-like isoform X1 [Procambarus clarkii]